MREATASAGSYEVRRKESDRLEAETVEITVRGDRFVIVMTFERGERATAEIVMDESTMSGAGTYTHGLTAGGMV